MAKFALVSGLDGRICQTANSESETFEVAGDLSWLPCADEVDVDYNYVNEQFVKRPKVMTNYQTARKVGYGDIGAQLGSIYDAFQSSDADTALTEWATRQTKVKALFPKGDANQLAVQAAQEEISRRMSEHEKYANDNNIPLVQVDFIGQLADEYLAGTWINPVSGAYSAQ